MFAGRFQASLPDELESGSLQEGHGFSSRSGS